MSKYTQAVMGDAAVILRDGEPMTVEQILEELNAIADEFEMTSEEEYREAYREEREDRLRDEAHD